MKLLINIPALNEEEKIAETIGRVPRHFEGISDVLVQVIDDGSTDKTVEEAKKGGADFIISHNGNRGLGVMFRTARENALKIGADIMVNIDADGQFDPNDIQKLIDPIIKDKLDIVIADRFSKSTATNIPYLKDKLNRLAAWLVSTALATEVVDLTCGFRSHSREALLRLNDPTGFTYTQENIIDAIGKNLKLKWVPVKVTYFAERKSRVVKTITKYVNSSARIIIKAFRDVRPMKFFGVPGSILMTIGLAFLLVFFVLYLSSFPEPKITEFKNYFLVGTGFFLVGLQFIVFALMADMIKSNRQLSEELLYQWRKKKYGDEK